MVEALVPAGSERRREVVRAVVFVLLLVPVAHALAVAHEWLYFPGGEIDGLLQAGPLRGEYRVPIALGTAGFLVEILLAAFLVALLRRGGRIPWRRAIADGAAHMFPLALAPLCLFRDDVGARLVLFSVVIAATVAAAVFRLCPTVSPATDAPSRWPRRLAPALVALACTYFASLALLRHAAYWSSIIDLGLFSGALRSTLHGGGFLYAPELGCTFMAEHFSPILVLLLPFQALYDSPATILVIQAVAVAGGAYLLFRLAEEVLGDGWLALAICASYLLAPDTFQAQWHDFHMDLLMPPMIFGAVWAIRRGSTRWFLLCVALLWATKEDAFIYTSVLAVYAWVAHGRRRLALGVLVASAALGAVLLSLVLPAYRQFQEAGDFYAKYVGAGYKFAGRYAHLGKGFGNVFLNVVSDPVYVIGYLTSDERFTSLLLLTAPLGFAALLGGVASLILLVPAGVMLLASDYNMMAMSFYYGAIPMAFAYAAGVVGLASIERRLGALFARSRGAFAGRFRAAATAWALSAALLLAWGHPDSRLSPVHDRPVYLRNERTRLLDEIVASIPPDVAVSATGYAGIHLMNRPRPRMLPFGTDVAQYVLVDLYRPPWPMGMSWLARLVERLAADPAWGVERAERGVILFRRGAPRDANRRALDMMYEPVVEPEEWESSDFANLAVEMPSASGGAALVVTPDDRRGAGFLYFGPYVPLPAGRYRIDFRMAAAPEHGRPANAVVATLEIFRNDQVLTARDVRFGDFARPTAWQTFSIEFDRDADCEWEFRVFYHDVGTLALDRIRVTRLSGG